MLHTIYAIYYPNCNLNYNFIKMNYKYEEINSTKAKTYTLKLI